MSIFDPCGNSGASAKLLSYAPVSIASDPIFYPASSALSFSTTTLRLGSVPEEGTATIQTYSVALRRAFFIEVATTSASISSNTGPSAVIRYSYQIESAADTLTFTGKTPTIDVTNHIDKATASATLTTQLYSPALDYAININVDRAILTGQALASLYDDSTIALPSASSLSMQRKSVAALRANNKFASPTAGALTIAVKDVGIKSAVNISMSNTALNFTTQTLSYTHAIDSFIVVAPTSLNFIGQTTTTQFPSISAGNVGTLGLVSHQPTIKQNTTSYDGGNYRLISFTADYKLTSFSGW